MIVILSIVKERNNQMNIRVALETLRQTIIEYPEEVNAAGILFCLDNILTSNLEDIKLLRDAVMLRNCLRVLTDGTGDGDGQLIEEGRKAVIATGYLENSRYALELTNGKQ
jgi:hypothetical protein